MKKDFENAIMAYINAFEKKQDLVFDYWAEDFIIADFGGTDFFNVDDIRMDIDTNQKPDLIINWNEAVIYNHELLGFINYRSWCMGKRY